MGQPRERRIKIISTLAKKNIIILTAVLTVVLFSRTLLNGKNMKPLRVGIIQKNELELIERLKTLTPFNYQLHSDAMILRSLHGRLVQYDSRGQLQGVLAEEWSWEDTTLTISPLKNVTSTSGIPLTSAIIANSLKMTILKKKEVHGALYSSLKGNTPEEKLSSIVDNGEKVEIHFISYSDLIIPTLAAVEYSIVLNPESISNSDTFGPYHVINDTTILHKNNNVPSEITAQCESIKFVPFEFSNELAEAFINNKIDIIPTSTTIPENFENKIIEEKIGIQHVTLPIKLSFFYVFNKSRDLSQDEINYARVSLQTFMQKIGYGNTFQIFPKGADGWVEQISSNISIDTPKRKISIGILKGSSEMAMMEDLVNFNNLFELKILNTPDERKSEIFDIYWVGYVDVTYKRSLAQVIYTKTMGLNSWDDSKWMNFIETFKFKADDSERIKMLEELNFSVQENSPSLIPVRHTPYKAYIRNGWVLDASTSFSFTPLYKVSR